MHGCLLSLFMVILLKLGFSRSCNRTWPDIFVTYIMIRYASQCNSHLLICCRFLFVRGERDRRKMALGWFLPVRQSKSDSKMGWVKVRCTGFWGCVVAARFNKTSYLRSGYCWGRWGHRKTPLVILKIISNEKLWSICFRIYESLSLK